MGTMVFISQPMRGKSEEEIKAERAAAVAAVEAKFGRGGATVIDSYRPEWEEEFKESSEKRVFFLGKSISLLSEADVAVFCKGWADASGCRMEEAIAREYDIERLYL
jgi:hypothetical protein